MKRKEFIKSVFGVVGMSLFPWPTFAGKPAIEIHFIRHATFVLKTAHANFLVDPMLSDKEEMDPVLNTKNIVRIPMSELPINADQLSSLLSNIQGIILTHTHRDHWDKKARELLTNKILPVICQPDDVKTLSEQGFSNLKPVEKEIPFGKLKITRTPAKHGTGEIGKKMAPASGFVIEVDGHVIYIAGDSIWCDEVKNVIDMHKPNTVVLNAGAAQFNEGDPITMSAQDVVNVCSEVKKSTKVIVVHMDTINHCLLTRKDLASHLASQNLRDRCSIPSNGETILLT
jgi:L-ascorbate metabolism protein UlaG (beta-lactamase superfamily)